MTENLKLDNDVHELILGDSFDQDSDKTLHSIRYDFKPASVDMSKLAKFDVDDKNSVEVIVPNVEGSSQPFTIYKGNRRPTNKECVLIIDHMTGEYRLERLCSQVQLKRVRLEAQKKPYSTPNQNTNIKNNNSKSTDVSNVHSSLGLSSDSESDMDEQTTPPFQLTSEKYEPKPTSKVATGVISNSCSLKPIPNLSNDLRLSDSSDSE